MPNPVGLNTTTLHMKFVEPDSTATPLQGSLTFTPTPSPILLPVQNVIVTGTETATLDVNGEATIELVSTDQAGENPTGWLYTVTEKLIGQRQRSYTIALPFTSGMVVELSDVVPTDPAPTYIPVVGPQGPPGIVTTVNGYSLAVITLTASDVNAVPASAVGAVSGVASLTAAGKHTASEYDGSTVVLVSTKGAANGVASLDSSAKVEAAQLGLASVAPEPIGTGAVGISTLLARQDHTHEGVGLTGTQTITGAKTFSTLVTMTAATAGNSALLMQNTSGAATETLMRLESNSGAVILSSKVPADTSARLALYTSGAMELGPGNASRDVTWYRSGVGVMSSTGQVVAEATAPAAAGHLTRKDYVDNNFTSLTGDQTISGVKTFTGAPVLQQSSAGAVALNVKVAGDTESRLTVAASGTLSFGSGGAAADVVISRTAGGSLNNTSVYQSSRTAVENPAFAAIIGGDTFDRWRAYVDGKLEWGSGTAARETNLYRSAAGVLKTDTNFAIGGGYLTLGSGVKKTLTSTVTTVANTASETIIASMPIPAGDLAVGAAFRIKIHCNVSFLSSASLTWRMRWNGIGGTNIGTCGPTTLSATAQTNKEVTLEAYVQVRSVSAGGTIFANLLEIRNTTQTGSIGEVQMGSSDGAVTVDTSSATSFVVTATWGAASASNTLSAYATIERLS